MTFEEVPVDRVIANLERQYNPGSPDAYEIAWRLGRVHALAYAQGVTTITVETGQQREFYGYGMESEMQPAVAKPGSRDARAREHLDSALVWYQRAYARDTGIPTIEIGYGWCLEQAGRKDEAKMMYRKVIAREFSGPRPYRRPPMKLWASEALDYLIPLLHPIFDWSELRLRKDQRKQAESFGTAISPIVIPLTTDLSLDRVVDDASVVRFDLDGTGTEQFWTWITSAAGWLVCDFDGSGRITSGRKLVGNVTFWVFWTNGFEVLKALDDDADGWLAGTELVGLKIWCDEDKDGVCRASELKSLDHHGVVALSTACSEIRFAGRGMWESVGGAKMADGSTRTLYDVVLLPRPTSLLKVFGLP